MNGGEGSFPEFHAVDMDRESFFHYEKTGEFRDGTVMIKELIGAGTREATSGKGYFMGDFRGLAVSIQDSKRFKDEPGYWAFFIFGSLVKSLRPSDRSASKRTGAVEDPQVLDQAGLRFDELTGIPGPPSAWSSDIFSLIPGADVRLPQFKSWRTLVVAATVTWKEQLKLCPGSSFLQRTTLTWAATVRRLELLVASRTCGVSASLKSTTSCPVKVLISWCMLATLMPVTSSNKASMRGRAVSSRCVRTCLSRSFPFSLGRNLARCRTAAVKTPWRRTRSKSPIR